MAATRISTEAWLSRITAANSEKFIPVFEAGASRILRDAGQPSTAAELQKPEKPKRRPSQRSRKRLVYMTVGARIEADESQPDQVRLAARILDQCAIVRTQLASGSSVDAVADIAVLFGLVIRLIMIDSGALIEAGAGSIQSQAGAVQAGKAKAAERREIAKRLYAEELDRNAQRAAPHSETQLRKDVAERAHADFPKQFKEGFTGNAIAGLLKIKT